VPECPTCGKQLDASVRFCPEDGTPLTDTAAATAMQTPTNRRPSSPPLALPLMLGNRYRLEQALGGGGMAKVYRAVDITLERDVAVKLINPELREEAEFDTRFQREARIASQLADPHIVVVHDFGLDATHGPFLVMEYLQGQSLRERLTAQGPLPLRAALQLSGQLMLALIHAHDKGIVHRDIKPDNIFLLNQSGVRLHVRVLDFGIARIYRRDEPGHTETLTRPGAVLGTPRYMSPEQLAGQQVDVRSDLYSAALVIFESLTGTLPYVSHKKLSELCPDAPQAFQEVLNQCLLQNPAERPATALDVYLRLQEPAKASGILLLPPGAMEKLAAASKAQQAATLPYVPAVTSRRWLWGILLILAVLLVLGLVGLALLHGLGPATSPTPTARESLSSLVIGDSRDEAVAKIKKAPDHVRTGNPWMRTDRGLLGQVLHQQNLGEEGDLDQLQTLSWDKPRRLVLLLEDKVRAVVLLDADPTGGSARGLKVGDKEGELVHRYASEIASESPLLRPSNTKDGSPGTPRAKGPVFGKIYRYDALGIGFEVREEKISAITLYPPQPSPHDENVP
jgi:hypothetical protein